MSNSQDILDHVQQQILSLKWMVDTRYIIANIINMINTQAIRVENCNIIKNASGYDELTLSCCLLYAKMNKSFPFYLHLNPTLFPYTAPLCTFVESTIWVLNDSCPFLEYNYPRGKMLLPLFEDWDPNTTFVRLAQSIYESYKIIDPLIPSLQKYIKITYKPVNDTVIPSIPIKDILVQNEIGKGSFSTVYTGLLKNTPFPEQYAQIALKITRNLDKKLLDVIRYEIDIQNRFKHNNIVEILGICTNADSFIIVMKDANYSLDKEISRWYSGELRVTNEHKRDICLSLCKAIQYMHTYRPPFIHRDIKVENILVFNNVYKIGDFGLACATNQPHKIFGGTRGYTAPEILMGDGSYSEIIDVYSIGSVILYIFSGHAPVELLPVEIVQQKKVEEYIVKGNRPSIPTSIPKEVQKVIELCFLPKESRPSIHVITGYILQWKPNTWTETI